MPGYDKTGPMGNGPKTGRGLGVRIADNQLDNGNISPCNRMRRGRNGQDGACRGGCGRRAGSGFGRVQGQRRNRAGLRGNGMGQGRIGVVDAE